MIKKFFGLLVVAATIVVLSACGSQSAKVINEPAKIVNKKVTVVSELYAGSTITAFEQELIKELARINHWDIQIVNTKWDDLFTKVKGDKNVLAISGITASDDRKKDYNFSDSYFKAYQLALFHDDVTAEHLTDLLKQGNVFGVEKETTGATLLQSMFKSDYATKVKEFSSFDDAMVAYKKGDIQVVVDDNAILLDYLNKNKMQGYKLLKDTNVPVEDWGIMLQKGNDELTKEVNDGLAKLKADGTYNQVYSKYFGQ